jgi:ABC-type sugar transport system ATPase subunit
MRCGTLPAGRRRLIEVARALMVRPRVLILDEPGAGLSRPERIELARRLRDAQDGGAALLVVDHDIDFLAACADRLICLERGRVVALLALVLRVGPGAVVVLEARPLEIELRRGRRGLGLLHEPRLIGRN